MKECNCVTVFYVNDPVTQYNYCFVNYMEHDYIPVCVQVISSLFLCLASMDGLDLKHEN